jgi:hypothetical protein
VIAQAKTGRGLLAGGTHPPVGGLTLIPMGLRHGECLQALLGFPLFEDRSVRA